MRKFPLILIVFLVGLNLNATDFLSVMAGAWDVPATWGGMPGDPKPGQNDNVIVAHNVTTSLSEKANNLTIISGATLTEGGSTINIYGTTTVSTGCTIDIQAKAFRCRGTLVLNGTVTGTASGRFYLITAGDFSGNGSMPLTGKLYISRNVEILAGTNMEKPQGEVRMGSITITNNGNFSCDDIVAGTSSVWLNNANSSLTIAGAASITLLLTASATGNSVTYSATGTDDQNIIKPILGRYYNLTIQGDDVASEKTLTGDINILGELNIDGSTLKAGSASSYDIDIKGSWYNNGGVFDPKQGFVSFNGSDDQELDNVDGVESFFDLYFSGSGILSLFTDLDIARNLSVDKEFETFGQAINIGGGLTTTEVLALDGSNITFDENYSGAITGDIDFDDVTINKTFITSTISIEAATTVTVSGTLEITQGTLLTNDNLVITSNAFGTGRIGNLSNAVVTGEVEVQRFFDGPTNGWHLMCSPVQGATLDDWNDDVILTGFVGSDYPLFDFNNATYYDETISGVEKDSGLVNATNVTESTSALTGWRMYIAAGATNLDVKGSLNVGSQSLPVSYTDNALPDEDGWNLVANPYVSTIDWIASSGWTKDGLEDAIYIWNPDIEQYSAYVEGMGILGGSRYIPSTQAFWVHADSIPTLTLDEPIKVSEDTEFKNNVISKNHFTVRISNANNRFGEVGIRLDDRATPGFDKFLDAHYLGSPNTEIPGLAIRDMEGKAYSIYSIKTINEETLIPLFVKVSNDQNHVFSFENVENFNQASCLRLVDTVLGTETPIISGESVTAFIEAGEYSDRFVLKMGAPIVAKTINPTCTENEDKILIDLPYNASWEINVYDELSAIVFNENSDGGLVESPSFDGGEYFVEVLSINGQCQGNENLVVIPVQNTPDINFTTRSATQGIANGQITTSLIGALPPYQFSWSNGETTSDLSDVSAGTYLLTVTDSRMCSYSTSVVVEQDGSEPVDEDKGLDDVESITMVNQGGMLVLNFDLKTKQNYELAVYNVVGQLIYTENISAVKDDRVDISSEKLEGVVLIMLNNLKNKDSITKRIAF